MSGNPTGSNVVPMPHAPASATAPPQTPMPFPMWGGGGSLPWGPGCCPPGGMDALMKCYCDVQAATAFICSVMVQCVQTNPAVVQAIIAAIEASGSSLPLIGVTNGVAAQPGQVGEFIEIVQSVPFTTAAQTQTVTMGILQPGDWDVWAQANTVTEVTNAAVILNPVPPGFSGALAMSFWSSSAEQLIMGAVVQQALISVPTLVALQVQTNQNGPGPSAGTMLITLSARRAR